MAKKPTPLPVQKPRRRIAARVSLRPGTTPGTLRPIHGSPPATVTVLTCDNGSGIHSVTAVDDLEKLPAPAEKGLHWVRVAGLGSIEPLQAVADFYGIRRLALEDTLSPGWRTKLEEQGEYAFFLLQAPADVAGTHKGEHLSLFCKHGLIVTFEDTPTALVDCLWERLEKEPPSGKIQHLAELVTHMVLDLIVDSFYPHLDAKDEELAELEERISDHVPNREELNRLHRVKRDLITLRRLLTPFKELRGDVQKLHTPESIRELRPFFNDLNDHIVQAGELLDTYYEVAKSLDEISQSMLSNRMNDIIKLLTIISTVFMPLSFIAGVYGMNFDTKYPLNMPELSLPFGYVLVLLLMAGVVGGMLWFFKKKDWF
ncbi:Magnesium and cobalt transporter CorA [uncultured delta proteobacterium]|uniref:Magnesium transport protein CorA n=1 Tax=uncultured delta proteobacterium TaxID=34034 RepID=A0A212K078_9DELT|nr:Magnesium and cobalt transporter CorA [uncultured delta proteobacterium]